MATNVDLMEYATDAAAQAAYVPVASVDDSYTKLLIHFDGADAAQAYTAETGQTVTFVGTAQLDTAQKKFGASALLLDGNSDYVTVPDSNDFALGAGDWTFDFWVRFNDLTGYQFFYSQYQDDISAFSIFKTSDHKLHFGGRNGDLTDTGFETTNAVSFSTNTWYHIACVRSGASGYIFVDGVSQPLTALAAFGTWINIAADPNIGRYHSAFYFFNGWIDEFRFSSGIARWTSNFTPETINYNGLMGYSEGTTKIEGSYSLKTVAKSATSLNKTLTKTVSPAVDLSRKHYIKLYLNSSRMGANIKIGFHDSGGTTTEITPDVPEFQDSLWNIYTLNLSAVSDANKNAIDSIIVTIVNADADNIFYIDNIYAGNTIGPFPSFINN